MHSFESLSREYNSEVIIPDAWHPPSFPAQDWLWIKNIAQSSFSNDAPIRNIKVGAGPAAARLTCQHRTQPRRNFTVFYRRIRENMILVLGVGSHPSRNQKIYDVRWVDGSSSRIDLAQKKKDGEEFLSNPIGGIYGFVTKDAVINRLHLIRADII